LDDDRFATAIVEGQNRVKSMALIHQKLYQVNELATIDVNDYVHSLIRELGTVYRSEKTVQHQVN
jgi:two-component sensor histidine kinase